MAGEHRNGATADNVPLLGEMLQAHPSQSRSLSKTLIQLIASNLN